MKKKRFSVEQIVAVLKQAEMGGLPYQDWDKGHGRIESRTCWVETDTAWLRARHPQWHSIHSIISVDSSREIKSKTATETRHSISSSPDTAEKALKKIRSHWAIENSLHWMLDMSFGEDHSRIRKENAPQITAVMRYIALNLFQLQKATMKRQSIKRLRKMAGGDNDILLSELRNVLNLSGLN